MTTSDLKLLFHTDAQGQSASFLDVIDDIASSGKTAADDMLDAYNNRWNGDIDKVYEEYSY